MLQDWVNKARVKMKRENEGKRSFFPPKETMYHHHEMLIRFSVGDDWNLFSS
jgi:hypothetical protein